MKKQAIFSSNKIILPLILPFLLAATLLACVITRLPAPINNRPTPEPTVLDPTPTFEPTSLDPTLTFDPNSLDTTQANYWDKVYVEYILDASGSMQEELDGVRKIDIAKEVLGTKTGQLPTATNVGLRVYGHRLDYQDDKEHSCQDIELMVPPVRGGRDQVLEKLPSLNALGMSPLSDSVIRSVNDFDYNDPFSHNSLVVISDGEETCGGDPCRMANELINVHHINFTMYVIGFDIQDNPIAQTQLQCLANKTGGVFLQAHNRNELAQALDEIWDTMDERVAADYEEQQVAVAVDTTTISQPTPVFVATSSTSPSIPTNTPVLSSSVDKFIQVFNEFGYEFRWSGGEVNFSDSDVVYVKVKNYKQIGVAALKIEYEWKNGTLDGAFTDHVFSGRWYQDGGSGHFELTFTSDFTRATGWWNDGDNTQKKRMCFKALNSVIENDDDLICSHPWIEIKKVNSNPIIIFTLTLVNHDGHSISINFTVHDLVTSPKNLQHLYKLENSAGDWQQVTYNRPIIFEELGSAKHTLLVKAVDEEGLESETVRLDIRMKEPSPTPEIQEVPTEPRYPIPGLGEFTLPQLLISAVGLAFIVALSGFGRVWWRQPKPTEWDIEHHFNPFIGEVAVKDPKMFFGRQEILDDVLRSIQATNFVVYGEKRIGKTSLLHQIDHRLSEMEGTQFDYLPVIITLHAVPEDRFFRELMSQMVLGIKEKGRYPSNGLALVVEQEQSQDRRYNHTTFRKDLIMLRSALDAQNDLALRLVLLVDEGDALKDYAHKTLAKLRAIFMGHAADYLKIALTCEGPDERPWELNGSPWMSIFGKDYWLTPFTDEEARQLIVEPVPHYGYQPAAVDLILERSQLVPRHIQNICRQTIAEMLADKTGVITEKHVERALSKVKNLPQKAV